MRPTGNSIMNKTTQTQLVTELCLCMVPGSVAVDVELCAEVALDTLSDDV